MNVGMLWFDNDPKAEITVKIERAASYYRNKYGANPTLCFVHPSMLPEEAFPSSAPQNGNGGETGKADAMPKQGWKSKGIEVRSTRSVLPNHFWIGINAAGDSERV